MSFPFPVSPSQINTARECWRKYGFDYIDKIESPPNVYAELGTEMHAHLEAWFKHGELPPLGTQAGDMARVALRAWPAPTRVDECEIHIGTETENAQYHGYQDIGHLHNKLHLRVVGDHKSCGDHKWAKTTEDLKKDPQAIVYAAAAMVRHNVDRVICKWVYTTRGKKPAKKVVQLIMTQADVEAGFDSLDETAKDIYFVRSQPGLTGMDLPPNPHACGMYGGCGHIKRCNLTPKEKLKGYMAQQTLREKIEANKKAKEAGQTIAKPAGKPAVASKGQESAQDKLKRLKAEKAAAKAAELEAETEPLDEDEELDEEIPEEEEEAPAPTPAKKTPKPASSTASPPKRELTPLGHPDSFVAKHVGRGQYRIDELDFTFNVSHKPTVSVA